MNLTTDIVNTSATSLEGRASAAIAALEDRKSFMGSLFGNNDTIDSTEGAIKLIRNVQIPRWKQAGLDIVETGADERVNGWISAGQEFAKAISEIDGYGEDATLGSVVQSTVSQSAKDVVDKTLPSFGLGLGVAGALVAGGIVVYILVLKKGVAA